MVKPHVLTKVRTTARAKDHQKGRRMSCWPAGSMTKKTRPGQKRKKVELANWFAFSSLSVAVKATVSIVASGSATRAAASQVERLAISERTAMNAAVASAFIIVASMNFLRDAPARFRRESGRALSHRSTGRDFASVSVALRRGGRCVPGAIVDAL